MWRKRIGWGNIAVNISRHALINTEESFTAENAEFAEFLSFSSAFSAHSAVEKSGTA
mgnify:CR=1 FL=1